METRWISRSTANAYIIEHHRHHGKVQGAILYLGLYRDTELIGVTVLGRPVSRNFNAQEVIEVTRLCVSEGTVIGNECSKLYGSCARIAKEMGFHKIITYILEGESGASLKAAGWHKEADGVGGADWNRPGRPRETARQTLFGEESKYPVDVPKQRWARNLK